ncbi:MAG TPA: TonB-dependent receptor, partial [Arenibacter sp.]|nr:TonB-dependent receptor [Arenibacter sp.]
MNTKFIFLALLVFTFHSVVFAQVSLNGEVRDAQGQLLQGANVSLAPANRHVFTDLKGAFKIPDILNGEYILTVTYLGAKTYTKNVSVNTKDVILSITMEDDLLHLQNVVVTGTFDPRTQLESNTSITTLEPEALGRTFPRGTADLLQAIPGTFTDPSAGEVFTKVYTRGISASAEDDMGWYYVSLQEDGLPVSLVQHSYYSPDMFQRLDLTTEKVEAIRGGSAAITSLNGPGGIYNFISHGPREHFGGEVQLQGGVQGEGNPLYRV